MKPCHGLPQTEFLVEEIERRNDRNMIKKIVTKRMLQESSIKDDLEYWLSRPSEERIAAVDFLRKQYHGNTARLQRSARVIQRTQS